MGIGMVCFTKPICSTMRVRSLRRVTMRRSTTSMRERQSASAFWASFRSCAGHLESVFELSGEGFELNFERSVSGVLIDEAHDGGSDGDGFGLAADLGDMFRSGDAESDGERQAGGLPRMERMSGATALEMESRSPVDAGAGDEVDEPAGVFGTRRSRRGLLVGAARKTVSRPAARMTWT